MDLNLSYTPEAEKDLAQTPPEFVRKLELFCNVQFELDVCALSTTAKVPVYYSLAEHGHNSLVLPWARMNWCNPPYSDIMPWVGKAVIEATRGNTTFMLIPDKPETAVTRACKKWGDGIFHMTHRMNFLRPDGTPFLTAEGGKQSPKFPVMVVIFTPIGLVTETRDGYIDLRPY